LILVTGGGGFIGSHLVDILLEQGQSIRVMEKPGTSIAHLPKDKIDIVFADLRDEAAINKVTKQCKQVYHLAADPNLWRKNAAEFDAINYQGTANIIKHSLENGTERVLHCSTESILTSESFQGGAVEDLILQEKDMLGPYCLSKFKAEQIAFEYAEKSNAVIVASPTLPVGPGDRLLTPPTRMNVAFCQGKLPAILDCKINLIDVRDVANGMIAAMSLGKPGIRYLLGNENMLLSDWLSLLGEHCEQAVPEFNVPYPLALSAAWFSEHWASYVTGKMPMATLTGVRLTQRSMHFDPAKSLSTLGIHPRPVRDSAREAVNWYLQQGWLKK
jgi:dihydroflavonol-4-reductase